MTTAAMSVQYSATIYSCQKNSDGFHCTVTLNVIRHNQGITVNIALEPDIPHQTLGSEAQDPTEIPPDMPDVSSLQDCLMDAVSTAVGMVRNIGGGEDEKEN